MMNNWDYGQSGMMSGTGGLAFLLWVVVFIDLILLGIWLWKQIIKKKS